VAEPLRIPNIPPGELSQTTARAIQEVLRDLAQRTQLTTTEELGLDQSTRGQALRIGFGPSRIVRVAGPGPGGYSDAFLQDRDRFTQRWGDAARVWVFEANGNSLTPGQYYGPAIQVSVDQGREVWSFACCQPGNPTTGTGIGNGGGGQGTGCCPDTTIPNTLTATFTNVSGCGCLDGWTCTLTFQPVIGHWRGNCTTPCHLPSVCVPGGGEGGLIPVEIDFGCSAGVAGAGCLNFILQMTNAGNNCDIIPSPPFSYITPSSCTCTPFEVDYNGVTIGSQGICGCCYGTVNISITP
jgi:hypothetical protein